VAGTTGSAGGGLHDGGGNVLEILETRRLMSAAYDPATRVLEVRGGDDHDFISVTRRRGELVITLGGGRQTFVAADVDLVSVFAGAGDDRVIGTRAGVRLNVNGEAGGDFIFGGAKADVLAGGPGNDTVTGGKGDDVLAGDEGDDTLTGGAGDDTLLDVSGEDFLAGNGGNDHFEDQDGRGVADGGGGSDSAVLFSEDMRIVSIERTSLAPGAVQLSEPAIDLFVRQAASGAVTAFVQATHAESGFVTQFGELQRTLRTFEVQAVGVDTLPPGTPRQPVPVVETRAYELGPLQPGVYTFAVRSGATLLARVQFVVTRQGLGTGTPTGPGQAPPTTVVDDPSFNDFGDFFDSDPLAEPERDPGVPVPNYLDLVPNGPGFGVASYVSWMHRR
jgi:hypothetical protein